MVWLFVLSGALTIVIIALLVKIALLHRAADEICSEFSARLEQDTNTLISVSGGDRHMRRLAAGINRELRLLRDERHRFQQGDLELREAVTNMSHDLRTPLTAICGYLDLLEREEKSGEAARYIDMIGNRIEALKELTEELFRYSVIASTTDGGFCEELSLNAVLEESFAAHYAILTERGIMPEISMPETKVLRSLDRSALSRIIGNIISNAVKYSDGDFAIELHESGKIVFSNAAADLSPVAVGKLFDRFFTVETGRNSTGLGLSIARLLTEQMGGTISAEYSDGRLSVSLEL